MSSLGSYNDTTLIAPQRNQNLKGNGRIVELETGIKSEVIRGTYTAEYKQWKPTYIPNEYRTT